MSASDHEDGSNSRFDISGHADTSYQIDRVDRVEVTTNHYHGPASGEVLIPRELPTHSRRFVNRTRELTLLRELLDHESQDARLLLVDGSEGVGKTDLVARWGSQLEERFPDGSIYCDLSMYEVDGSVDVTEVLGSLLNSLNVSRGVMLATAEGRARQWRSVTHERKLMVVLDNIEEPALTRYLVPSSPSSTTVLISRVNAAAFVALGADRVQVTPFDSDHSKKLLASICDPNRLGTDPEAVDGLLDLCDGRPGTVALLGGCITTAPTLSLRELLREIAAKSRVRSHETTEIITRTMAVEAVGSAARELYRRLRAHPGEDVPYELLRALAPDETAALVEELADAELLTPSTTGRWRVPGGGRADAEAFRPTLDWYLAMARRADRVATSPSRLRLSIVDESKAEDPNWIRPAQALDWLEREVRNLVAIQNEAEAHGWDDAVVALEESLWVLYLKRPFPGFQEATSQLAVEAAVRLPDRKFESRMRAQRGRLLWQRGAFDEALSESLRARELAADTALRASATEMTGRVYLETQRNEDAIAMFTEAERAYVRLDDVRGLALSRQFLAQAQMGLGNIDLATKLLNQAMEGFVRVGAEPDQGRVLLDSAKLHYRVGEHGKALAELSRSIVFLEEAGMHERLSMACALRGEILLDDGDPQAARAAWHDALRAQERQHNGEGPEASQLRAKLAAL